MHIYSNYVSGTIPANLYGGFKSENNRRKNKLQNTLSSSDEFIIEAKNKNLYFIYEVSQADILFEFFIQPTYSNFIQSDILTCHTIRWFTIIVLDPPWRLAGSDLIRGPRLMYYSMSFKVLKKIPLNKFQPHGLIFIWVLNRTLYPTLEWLTSEGYQLLDLLFNL